MVALRSQCPVSSDGFLEGYACRGPARGPPPRPGRLYRSPSALPGLEKSTSGGLQQEPGLHSMNEGELEGHLAIAGYTKALWELPRDMLPPTPAAKHGKVIAGFYQVHKDSVEPLEVFLRYLTDTNSRPWKDPISSSATWIASGSVKLQLPERPEAPRLA
eukprot:s5059_g1.t1